MVTKVQKWGNSLAVRLPKKAVDKLGLREGNEVTVDGIKEQIVIKRIVPKANTIRKREWKQFMIPSNKKKEEVSENIDKILYGKSS